MSDDSRHGIAATMVIAEHLTEKAPDGPDRAEHTVSIRDAMVVENVQNLRFGQDIRKRESLIACETSADRIQAGHGMGFPIMGSDCMPQVPGNMGQEKR